MTELAFYLGLVLIGVFVLALLSLSHVTARQAGIQWPAEAQRVLDSELARGGPWRWSRLLVGFVSMAAIGSGIAGLIYRLNHLGQSQERRSAGRRRDPNVAQHTAAPDSPDADSQVVTGEGWRPRGGGLAAAAVYPTVPPVDRRPEVRPGRHLPVRLVSASTGRRRLFGIAALALTWNSVCLVLLAVVVSGWWYAQPRPVLAMLMLPFSGVSFWSMRGFLREIRRIAGVGSTSIELSDYPLRAGGGYDGLLIQMGRMRLRQIKIELVCEEQSYFRQGTDVRVETHEAMRKTLHLSTSVRVDPKRPWQQQFHIVLPENAMHSFVANNNTLRWRLIVTGESRPWPSFCRSFPIIVHPADRLL